LSDASDAIMIRAFSKREHHHDDAAAEATIPIVIAAITSTPTARQRAAPRDDRKPKRRPPEAAPARGAGCHRCRASRSTGGAESARAPSTMPDSPLAGRGDSSLKLRIHRRVSPELGPL
jgi:hypothetical protein